MPLLSWRRPFHCNLSHQNSWRETITATQQRITCSPGWIWKRSKWHRLQPSNLYQEMSCQFFCPKQSRFFGWLRRYVSHVRPTQIFWYARNYWYRNLDGLLSWWSLPSCPRTRQHQNRDYSKCKWNSSLWTNKRRIQDSSIQYELGKRTGENLNWCLF